MEWAIDSEAMRARGVTVSIKSNQLVKKISTKHLALVKARLSFFADKTLQIWWALFATSGLQHIA